MRKRIILLLVILITIFTLVPIKETEVETKRVWTVEDSKAYAQDALYDWKMNQWYCLDKLWTKESNWRHNAFNPVKVMGKNAGGIPQILGLSPNTNPPAQIDRGISYIIHRYGTPCMAWKHWQKNRWY
jgi:hypothetical protein